MLVTKAPELEPCATDKLMRDATLAKESEDAPSCVQRKHLHSRHGVLPNCKQTLLAPRSVFIES